MITTEPERAWLTQALAALEEALAQPLDLWGRSVSGEWKRIARSADGARDDRSNLPPVPDTTMDWLLEQAAERGAPTTTPLIADRHLLAVPLGDQKRDLNIAVTIVATEDVDLLVRLATVSQRLHRQQAQLVRLLEENNFFVKQISDDFEELTFLRSMAERLSLGEGNDDIPQFIHDLVPTLGAAVHAEALYFVQAPAHDVGRVLARWNSHPHQVEPYPYPLIRRLVQQYGHAADVQPVIRNRFAASAEGRGYPDVREFLLVSVAGSTGRLGYFLAINRNLGSAKFVAQAPQWQLSQYEFGTSEASLLRTAGAMLTSHANNLALFEEREDLLISVVRSLVSAIEAKDRYTCGHSERVALYAKRLAEQLGYDEKATQRLYLTGLLHDIGKIAVSDAVLNKPGRLTDEEFAEIKRHPDEGWVILNELRQLSYVLPGVLHHHERTDGQGYPDGLGGEEIPMDGRILAVADAYDAMTSNRAYRQGMSQEKAEAILREGAGTQWDADVVDAFFTVVDDIVALRHGYQPRQRPERKPKALATSTT